MIFSGLWKWSRCNTPLSGARKSLRGNWFWWVPLPSLYCSSYERSSATSIRFRSSPRPMCHHVRCSLCLHSEPHLQGQSFLCQLIFHWTHLLADCNESIVCKVNTIWPPIIASASIYFIWVTSFLHCSGVQDLARLSIKPPFWWCRPAWTICVSSTTFVPTSSSPSMRCVMRLSVWDVLFEANPTMASWFLRTRLVT